MTPHWKAERQPKAAPKRLKARSTKTAAVYRNERVPLVERLVEAIPVCQVCDAERSVTLHEKQFRSRGGSILDLENLVVIGQRCHDRAHLDKAFADEHDLAHHATSTMGTLATDVDLA